MATKARQKLETFLDRKVYLEVKVKVMEDWRSNKEALMKFGYIDTDEGSRREPPLHIFHLIEYVYVLIFITSNFYLHLFLFYN